MRNAMILMLTVLLIGGAQAQKPWTPATEAWTTGKIAQAEHRVRTNLLQQLEAQLATLTPPVSSVNGRTGAVIIAAEDVGAVAAPSTNGWETGTHAGMMLTSGNTNINETADFRTRDYVALDEEGDAVPGWRLFGSGYEGQNGTTTWGFGADGLFWDSSSTYLFLVGAPGAVVWHQVSGKGLYNQGDKLLAHVKTGNKLTEWVGWHRRPTTGTSTYTVAAKEDLDAYLTTAAFATWTAQADPFPQYLMDGEGGGEGVPYTGATADLDLGSHRLLAGNASDNGEDGLIVGGTSGEGGVVGRRYYVYDPALGNRNGGNGFASYGLPILELGLNAGQFNTAAHPADYTVAGALFRLDTRDNFNFFKVFYKAPLWDEGQQAFTHEERMCLSIGPSGRTYLGCGWDEQEPNILANQAPADPGATVIVRGGISSGSDAAQGTLTLKPGDVPATPQPGMIYFNSTDSHFYGFNGSGWVQLDNN